MKWEIIPSETAEGHTITAVFMFVYIRSGCVFFLFFLWVFVPVVILALFLFHCCFSFPSSILLSSSQLVRFVYPPNERPSRGQAAVTDVVPPPPWGVSSFLSHGWVFLLARKRVSVFVLWEQQTIRVCPNKIEKRTRKSNSRS